MTLDVYLAPGHGRHPVTGRIDPGTTDGDASEQRDGDLICRAAEKHLVDVYGLTVYRQPRGGPDFRGTIPDIERRKPRVAVEVHHDWNRAPRGGFGFWRNDQQRRLADAIHTHYLLSGLTVRPHMRHLPGTSSYPAIVRQTHAVLWEADRIGSVTDHGLYGRVLADGIADYLNAQPLEDDMPLSDDDVERVAERVARKLGWYDPDRGKPRSYQADASRIRETVRALARKVGVPDDDIRA